MKWISTFNSFSLGNQHSLSLFYKMGVGLIQGGQCRLMKTCLKTQKFKKLIKI